jgi:hypothetical protein
MIGKFIRSTNRLINRMDRRTQDTVKQTFYLLVIVLSVVGAIVGMRKGRSSAQIPSAPILEYTNEAFDLDRKRERVEGDFSEMMDEHRIREEKMKGSMKIDFPSNTRLDMEGRRGIVEEDSGARRTTSPDLLVDKKIYEGNYDDPERRETERYSMEKREIYTPGKEEPIKERRTIPDEELKRTVPDTIKREGERKDIRDDVRNMESPGGNTSGKDSDLFRINRDIIER